MPSTTMHAPQQPHMPLATRHAPRRPHMPHPTATVHASPWTEWRTGVKILPCPELRLRAVTRLHSGKDVYRPLQWWPGAGWPCPLSQIPPPCRDPSLLEGRWVGIRQLDRKWHHTETTLVDRQTPVKILPCCKLRLRAVTSVYDITNHTSTLAWWKFYEHILYKFVCAQLNSKWTRMHSSRMRTGRSLTVCRGGGVCFPGVPSSGGVGGIPACTEADPPVNRITDTSKNITLATTSLRPVIKTVDQWFLKWTSGFQQLLVRVTSASKSLTKPIDLGALLSKSMAKPQNLMEIQVGNG